MNRVRDLADKICEYFDEANSKKYNEHLIRYDLEKIISNVISDIESDHEQEIYELKKELHYYE